MVRIFAFLLLFITGIAVASPRILLGRVETGLLEHKKITVKLDTGAKTSSLDALDIEHFKKDDKDWVRFKVSLNRRIITLERQVVRHAKIKNRSSEQSFDDDGDLRKVDDRPVVNVTLCLGSQQQEIEVNLADRSDFNYPLLLGRAAMLQFNILIDPQEIYTQEPNCEKTKK
jgi:hypothetical protein